MTPKQCKELKQGQRVRIAPLPYWYKTMWFPKVAEVTGMVEGVTSRGRVNVAVDQLPRASHQWGHLTLQFEPKEVVEVIL